MKRNERLVSIIIPAYDEAENLRLLLPQIKAATSKIKNFSFEIIVNCNNCSDDSAKVVRGLGAVCIEKKYSKPSKSQALLDGFAASKGELFLTSLLTYSLVRS